MKSEATCVTGVASGWDFVCLNNDRLRVSILPEKGADIYEFVDLVTGVDVLFKSPLGLRDRTRSDVIGVPGKAFLANYEGAWQELFPNVGDACSYRGRAIPFHGEVATLAWSWELVEHPRNGLAIRLNTRCELTPFTLERVVSLDPERPRMVLEETVTNVSDVATHLAWGHHCVVGAPFLEQGCRIDVPARTIITGPATSETRRLTPCQRERWPYARLERGGMVDLREVPARNAGCHDDVFLTELDAGWASVTNPRLGLRFRLAWDVDTFTSVVLWQPYGGVVNYPLEGTYALGVEPWTTPHCLERSVAAGQAIELEGGAHLTTRLDASLTHVSRANA